MADVHSIISNMAKVGVCSTSDEGTGTLTATFPDRDDMVSGDLPVVYFGGLGRRRGVPQPGDTVACIFLGNGMSDGFVIGNLYDDDDPPGEDGQEGVFYEDGSYVYYDTVAGILNVMAMSGVVVETPETATIKASSVIVEAENVQIKAANVTIDGNLSVTGTVSASNIEG